VGTTSGLIAVNVVVNRRQKAATTEVTIEATIAPCEGNIVEITCSNNNFH